jgi:S-formylglutathione hydrolase
MYSYVTKELPDLVNRYFHIDGSKTSITGFSMGGLGALLCSLKNPTKYRSVSAFAPISNPSNGKNWGPTAFKGFLGSIEAGKDWDPTILISNFEGNHFPLLVDLGSGDKWATEGELLIDNFLLAANKKGFPVDFRKRDHYDHSFYYVASFLKEHFKFHASYLNTPSI